MRDRPNPYSPTCRITLDLPWETAQLIVGHGPQLLAAISAALEARSVETARNDHARTLLDQRCEANKAKWAALAQYCETQIAMRSAGRKQRAAIIKQLAAELYVTAAFIKMICKVFRSHQNPPHL